MTTGERFPIPLVSRPGPNLVRSSLGTSRRLLFNSPKFFNRCLPVAIPPRNGFFPARRLAHSILETADPLSRTSHWLFPLVDDVWSSLKPPPSVPYSAFLSGSTLRHITTRGRRRAGSDTGV